MCLPWSRTCTGFPITQSVQYAAYRLHGRKSRPPTQRAIQSRRLQRATQACTYCVYDRPLWPATTPQIRFRRSLNALQWRSWRVESYRQHRTVNGRWTRSSRLYSDRSWILIYALDRNGTPGDRKNWFFLVRCRSLFLSFVRCGLAVITNTRTGM